jgi:hypothetical protein
MKICSAFIGTVFMSNFRQKKMFGVIFLIKGQSHEKVGEMSVWGISLGPN